MGTVSRCAITLGILAVSAVGPAAWAASDPRTKFAAPTAQEETIYRPECPSNETSNVWPACRVAGANGG
jgi:hypothetical protein